MQSAAAEGKLGETIHRRGNASLSFFAATCLGLPFLSYLTNPIITPTAGAIFGALSAAQWLAAGRGYAKHSPEGANPFAILGVRTALMSMDMLVLRVLREACCMHCQIVEDSA